MSDPDPWCEEADGTYTPPEQPEIIYVQADVNDDRED